MMSYVQLEIFFTPTAKGTMAKNVREGEREREREREREEKKKEKTSKLTDRDCWINDIYIKETERKKTSKRTDRQTWTYKIHTYNVHSIDHAPCHLLYRIIYTTPIFFIRVQAEIVSSRKAIKTKLNL